MTSTPVTESLRRWARGIYPVEAAVELLTRSAGGRFARESWPWIEQREDRFVLDVEQITEDSIGVLSGGERRILRIVASLAGGSPTNLYEDVAGLDRDSLDLVLAAIAHAGGSHEDRARGSRTARGADGEPVQVPWPTDQLAGSLHSWPQEKTH